jgi:hypothetical protein
VFAASDYRLLGEIKYNVSVTADQFIIDAAGKRLLCVDLSKKLVYVLPLEVERFENPVDYLFTNRLPETAAIGEALSWKPVMYQAGEKALTFRLAKAPAGMTINEAIGEVSWRPAAEETGVYRVIIEAVGPDGSVVRQEAAVNVGVPQFSLALDNGQNPDQSPEWVYAAMPAEMDRIVLYDQRRFVVAIIDAESKKVLAEVPSVESVHSLVCVGRLAIVASGQARDLQAIDIDGLKEAWRARMESGCQAIVLFAREGREGVLVLRGNLLEWLDIEKKSVEKLADLGSSGRTLAVSPDGKWLYVNQGDGSSPWTVIYETAGFTRVKAIPAAFAAVHPATGMIISPTGIYAPDGEGFIPVVSSGYRLLYHPSLPVMMEVRPVEGPPDKPQVRVAFYSAIYGTELASVVFPVCGQPVIIFDSKRSDLLLCGGTTGYVLHVNFDALLADKLVPSLAPPLNVEYGKDFAYAVRFLNAGKDAKIAVQSAPEGMALDAEKNILTWTPAEEQRGQVYQIRISAANGSGGKMLLKFPLTAALKETPLPFGSNAHAITSSGKYIVAFDAQRKNLLILSLETGKVHGAVPLSGAADWFWLAGDKAYVTSQGKASPKETVYDVIDVESAKNEGELKASGMTVVEGEYILPQWTPGAAFCATADGRHVFTMVGVDAEREVLSAEYRYRLALYEPGNSVKYILRQGPEGMKIDEKTGEVTWTPGHEDINQQFNVAIEAVDGQRSGLQSFYVTVMWRALPVPPGVERLASEPPSGTREAVRFCTDS